MHAYIFSRLRVWNYICNYGLAQGNNALSWQMVQLKPRMYHCTVKCKTTQNGATFFLLQIPQCFRDLFRSQNQTERQLPCNGWYNPKLVNLIKVRFIRTKACLLVPNLCYQGVTNFLYNATDNDKVMPLLFLQFFLSPFLNSFSISSYFHYWGII